MWLARGRWQAGRSNAFGYVGAGEALGGFLFGGGVQPGMSASLCQGPGFVVSGLPWCLPEEFGVGERDGAVTDDFAPGDRWTVELGPADAVVLFDWLMSRCWLMARIALRARQERVITDLGPGGRLSHLT